MKVLIVGGGGREHALALKIMQSPKVAQIICAPGNGGMASIAKCVPIRATDIEGMLSLAKEEKVDLVVIAPDDPLVMGMADAFEAAGMKAFGPNAAAAAIEGSKVIAKEIMEKYHIPTAGYQVFKDAKEALAYIQAQNSYPTVIKAEGLALGKGVVLAKDYAEAEKAITEMMVDKIFGNSGSRVVIEEFLTGPEVSVLAFTDGTTIKPMVSAQDHKRAFDGDEGPNTGGMGTFSPSEKYTKQIEEQCMREIFIPTIEGMKSEGRTFRGTLFFGLMLTENGPKVIEYNCRFGDPETQVVLPRLKTDIVEIMLSVIDGTLADIDIQWEDNAAVCVVAASGGYPGRYTTGRKIAGLDTAQQMEDITVYHAGTALSGEDYVTAGGRVLGVTATAKTIWEARERAYHAIEQIAFEGMHYRKDIGIK